MKSGESRRRTVVPRACIYGRKGDWSGRAFGSGRLILPNGFVTKSPSPAASTSFMVYGRRSPFINGGNI